MSAPSAVNQTASNADSVIQFSIMNFAANLVIKDLQAQFPVLALPIVSTIFTYFVNYFCGIVSKKLQLFVTFLIIDSQIGTETGDYEKAEQALRKACAAGDAGAIIKTSADFDNALAALVHFDGSAAPK